MVKLIVDDFEQITMLEWMLVTNNIHHEISLNESNNGIKPPYLIVDGVPLDFNRSLKWLKGLGKHE